jgi:hypothetical protein
VIAQLVQRKVQLNLTLATQPIRGDAFVITERELGTRF